MRARLVGLALLAAGCAGGAGSTAESTRRCGDSDATAFDVHLAFSHKPYNSDKNSTWDWNGTVPDDVFELIDGVQEFLGYAQIFIPDPRLKAIDEGLAASKDILEIIDTYAPHLSEYWRPPDRKMRFFTFDAETDYFHTSHPDLWAQQDSYGPVLLTGGAYSPLVSLDTSEWWVMKTTDEDSVLDIIDGDDEMGDVAFSRQFLRELAGCYSQVINAEDSDLYGEGYFISRHIMTLNLYVRAY